MIDKDLARFKFVDEDGTTYYYAEKHHLVKGLTEGGFSPIKMASYIVDSKGYFSKSRSFNTEIVNSILAIGRNEVEKLLDFMEKN
ncbi:hypothetical protein phiPsa347_148 [Pseudomonas phage phiPsa347]|uniref:Uncharacterized protein n=1 Tax=Pseudomonas phage phiPsa347 TaxID=1460364 RepID=A0A7G9V2I5_9CAUD|nr:hypothetical protein QGX18_gp080 [Pseudomonas phage phiPsa347]QNO00491.1 hypothetical protein phiPsa347_148 [Pseudomonas phage phiPsa347]